MDGLRLRHHQSEDLWELAGVYASINTESAEKFLNNVLEELKRRGELNELHDDEILEVVKEIRNKQLQRRNVQQYISEIKYSIRKSSI